MKLNEYQEKIIRFDVNGNIQDIDRLDFAFLDKVLGLAGESGEVADKVKKIIRDKSGKISPEDRMAIGKELGDVLWYLSTVARYLGLDLDTVANQNIEKLESRLRRDKISGSGDER